MFKKLIIFFCVNFFFFHFAYANVDIKARTAILQDFLSGEILYEKEPDRSIYPASMTKIMTSIIAFDLIKSGDLNLDDKFIGQTISNEQGIWRLHPNKNIKPGLYTLRADQVDENGKVLARVSMPFSRAEPITDVQQKSIVIVQPGNSLWRLAYKAYGKGMRYTTIFQANKSQIKNPDLIYPGQVFTMPTEN